MTGADVVWWGLVAAVVAAGIVGAIWKDFD